VTQRGFCPVFYANERVFIKRNGINKDLKDLMDIKRFCEVLVGGLEE